MAKHITPPDYRLGELEREPALELPEFSLLPKAPKSKRGIALVGCGAITEHHLKAYRSADLAVVAMYDINGEAAREKRRLYYPDAVVCESYTELLARDEVEVVDLATHPDVRVGLTESALTAGKHVLSQKPLAKNLDDAKRLVELAEQKDVLLAVNQNGRWAPHFRVLLEAYRNGFLGAVSAFDAVVHFDHNWVVGTAFYQVVNLLLFDLGIHWFDLAAQLFPGNSALAWARVGRTRRQKSAQPLAARVCLEFEDGYASFAFHGDSVLQKFDTTVVSGDCGAYHALGPDMQRQYVTLRNADGAGAVPLSGAWFPDGFEGSMTELLNALDEGREPEHSGRNNLRSLALCFAACASSHRGGSFQVGSVNELPE